MAPDRPTTMNIYYTEVSSANFASLAFFLSLNSSSCDLAIKRDRCSASAWTDRTFAKKSGVK
jgi:hypothetical protein